MSIDLRLYIRWRNFGIAMRNTALAIGDNVVPDYQAFAEKLQRAYETLQRIRLYHALPAWLPYRAQIAQRWPKRWLPSSTSVLEWMNGESDADTHEMDQR